MRYKLRVWYTDGSSTDIEFSTTEQVAKYIATSEHELLVLRWELTDTRKQKRKRTQGTCATKEKEAARRMKYEDYHPGDDTIH